MLLSAFSFSILTSIATISITSKRRPPRPHSQPLSPPLPAGHPQTHAALVKGGESACALHRHRIERCAVRGVGGGWAPGIAQLARTREMERGQCRVEALRSTGSQPTRDRSATVRSGEQHQLHNAELYARRPVRQRSRRYVVRRSESSAVNLSSTATAESSKAS